MLCNVTLSSIWSWYCWCYFQLEMNWAIPIRLPINEGLALDTRWNYVPFHLSVARLFLLMRIVQYLLFIPILDLEFAYMGLIRIWAFPLHWYCDNRLWFISACFGLLRSNQGIYIINRERFLDLTNVTTRRFFTLYQHWPIIPIINYFENCAYFHIVYE